MQGIRVKRISGWGGISAEMPSLRRRRIEHMKRQVLLLAIGIFLTVALGGCKKGG
jgi:hypothetical protein